MYKSYLISNRPHMQGTVFKYLGKDHEVEYYDGSKFESFSKLVNTCTVECPTEVVLMMSDKVSPKKHHFDVFIDKINQGYGLVGLYRLGFFGFKKELFRKIGMMDERFLGGGFEDDDLYTRLLEADIAMYLTSEVEFRREVSGWKRPPTSKQHCEAKWNGVPKFTLQPKRMIGEETYNYDLGPSTGDEFLPYSQSHINLDQFRYQKYKELIRFAS